MKMTASVGDAGEKDPQYALIVAHLGANIDMLPVGSIKQEITAQALRTEADLRWQTVMDDYLSMLRSRGWADRQDLIDSKQQVYAGWKRQRDVFLDQLKTPGTALFRYDEGAKGSLGYVITQNGRPRYWLHLQFKGN